MSQSNSVVINPVLCYVNSHRRLISDEDLRSIVSGFFENSCVSSAYELLLRQTAPFLNASDDRIAQFATVDDVENIIRLFHLCDRYQINLPEFGVTDLNKLPPPPNAGDSAGLDLSLADRATIPSAVQTTRNSDQKFDAGPADHDKVATNALFARRTLLKIVKELKDLKSLVLELALKKTEPSTVNMDADVYSDADDLCQLPVTNDDDEKATRDECRISDNSAESAESPSQNGARSVDGQHSPSRGSSISVSVAALTPSKRRTNSRSSSSIEDAVAKIKAQRGGGAQASIPQDCSISYDVGGSPRSKRSKPKVEVDDPIDGNKSTVSTPLSCDTGQAKSQFVPNSLFPPTFDVRSLAAAMFPGGVPRFDLVNSAAASFIASGVLAPSMVAAALSPQGHCLPPFSTPIQSSESVGQFSTQRQPMDAPYFTSPNSTTQTSGLLLRQQEQRQTCLANIASSPQAICLKSKKAKRHVDQEQLDIDLDNNELDSKSRRSNLDEYESTAEAGHNAAVATKTGDGGSEVDKPYMCLHPNCHKRFANKFLLKKHAFIHTGKRPFQCPYCYKTFNRKDNLLRHKSTHEKNHPVAANFETKSKATKIRRRRCRVFGVKTASESADDSSMNLAPGSASSSAMANYSWSATQPRATSSASTDDSEMADHRAASTLPHPPTIFQHAVNASTPSDYSLAALAFSTALAQSHWPQAALSLSHLESR